jgi:hypothetical protein
MAIARRAQVSKTQTIIASAARDQIQATPTLPPYVNSHGTITQGHYPTSPNTTRLDNFGTRGNVNPYTGDVGTRGARY